MKPREAIDATADSLRMALWTVLVLICGILLGLAITAWTGRERGGPRWEHDLSQLHSPFGPVVEEVLPAVVSIEVEKRFRHSDLGLGGGNGDSFDPDFGDEEFDIPSSGSGFIIDSKGYLITNDHVVRDAVRIDVQVSGGVVLSAQLVGRDPMTDIAVLKVDSAEPLPVVPLGDSDDVRIGDWVIAIGNPLGMLEGSVTAGIVSAKGRTDIAIRGGGPSYQDFIQTDASINPGNSGGPLVNERGEAIGVNTAYNAPGNGIGFAISMNMAREVAEQLIRKGRVPRALLGVSLIELDPDLARGWGLDGVRGVIVSDVQAGSPAGDAGIEEGDIIIEFDSAPIRQVSAFRLQVARTEVGRRVGVRLLRRGRPVSLEVHLIERDDPVPALPREAEADPQPELGLSVVPYGSTGEGGVYIDSVAVGGPAFQAGLREGDRILEVGWVEVSDQQAFTEELERSIRDRGVAVIRVERDGDRAFMTLPPR